MVIPFINELLIPPELHVNEFAEAGSRRIAQLARLEARARAANKAQLKPKPAITAPTLRTWPDEVRGVPNAFLRSALFGAVRKGSRAYLKMETIKSIGGVQISYTGTRLDQIDLSVWQSVLHLARRQMLGQELRYKAYGLLKLMKKTDTGKNRKLLHDRLLRLAACTFEVVQGDISYKGSLIKDVYKDEDSLEYVVFLDTGLNAMFSKSGFSYIDWNIRSALDGQPLAQWLHGFYSSHAKAYKLKVSTLHQLCGSEAREIWKFTQTLCRAFDSLSAVYNKHGKSFEYAIRGDLVHIQRQKSPTQHRHISKVERTTMMRAVLAGREYRTDR